MKTRIFTDRVIAYKKDQKYLAVSLEFDLYELFVEQSEKKRKKEVEKKKELQLKKKEISSTLWTYNSENLCNA